MRGSLKPGQLHLASAAKFASCYRNALANGGYDSVTYQDTVRTHTGTVQAGGARVAATYITADIAFSGHEPITRRMTLAWYADGSMWRWIADKQVRQGLRAGQC